MQQIISVFNEMQPSCSYMQALVNPLYDAYHNSLHPCFLAAITITINVFFIVPIGYQLVKRLFFNSFGPFPIKYSFGSIFNVKSVGMFNLLKFNSVFIHILLSTVLYSFEVQAGGLQATSSFFKCLTLITFVMPLHLIEPTRSIVASTSLLFYWWIDMLVNLVVLTQDLFSDHKIYVPESGTAVTSTVLVVEILLFLNSIVVFSLEAWFYKPAIELVEYYELNGWDPRRERNIFTRIFFTHLWETIKIARKTGHIEVDDLPPFPIEIDNDVAYASFLKYWNASVAKTEKVNKKLLEKSKKTGQPFVKQQPSLFWPLFFLTKKYFFCCLFFNLLETVAYIIHPILLKYFLLFATDRYLAIVEPNNIQSTNIQHQPVIVGFGLATGIYMLSVAKYVGFNRYFVSSQCMNNAINTALSSHIYNKGMKLSPKARKSKSVGELVNSMASDITPLKSAPNIMIHMVVRPVSLIMYMAALYSLLGVASLAGLFTAVVLIPCASASFMLVVNETKRVSKFRDKRAKLTGEIMNSIKSIKLYSWENSMLTRLSEVRNNEELKVLKKIGIMSSMINFVWDSIPVCVAIASFTCAAVLSRVTLTPAVVFPALAIFDSLSVPILDFPRIFSRIASCKVAIERVLALFSMEELAVECYEKTEVPLKKGDDSVIIKDATFVWEVTSNEALTPTTDEEADIESSDQGIALRNINYRARKGELSCIVGKVGSGKSTFLKAVLGCIPLDTKISQPTLTVNGTVAYCAQNAWILNSTVRENILFGRKYDPVFYRTVVAACELNKDVEILPDGDRTVVGEKGISLSGGQKARISLARAVYSRADIYILDDVLSAVDTHVGKNIIRNVLGRNGLLSGKTTILATNSVPVLHEASNIVLLSKGEIVEHGQFDEVMAAGSELASLINEFGKKENEVEEEKVSELISVQDTASSSSGNEVVAFEPDVDEEGNGLELKKVTSSASVAPSFVSYGHNYETDFKDDTNVVRRTGDTEEIQSKGKASMAVYRKYINACGVGLVIFYVSVMLFSTLVILANTYILKSWSEENAREGTNSHISVFLVLYSAAGVVGALCTLVSSSILFALVAIRGSKFFHDTMALSVLRAPMSFFETTPVGRILNRFTEDISVADSHLTYTITYITMYVLKALVVFGIVIYNLPVMLLVIIVLLFLYESFRKWFIPASREFKRVRSARKSPIFSHLQESITGVDTVVAYGQVDRFKHTMSENLNKHLLVEQSNLACDGWLSMRLEGLSSIVVYLSTLMILVSLVSDKPFGPGLVGFLMTYIIDVTSILSSIIENYADLESKAITLERLFEYCRLTPEAPLVIESSRPPKSWPAEGAISFKGYETRYRDNLDSVLKNLSFDIRPSEKVGIVGRTGAGKSTLTLALFRIIEATSGHIEVDGIDTSKIGLYDLRSRLNIIPQDSQAMYGSVRYNLDPLGQHTDAELWNVLELSHLKEHVQNMKTEELQEGENNTDAKTFLEGLDALVEEGGSNLSVGQKQLMCLARSLLNPSKVLILDEATASVDVRTDKIIQETIRSEFKDKTILTIAHRIETILDSDRILVLDGGEIKEFDSPESLLQDKEGTFYSLCKQGGHI